MKINLTRVQYRTLLKIFYLGDWMKNSFKFTVDKETESLEQHIFALAKTFDCTNWIEKDKESGEYYATQELEAELNDYMDDYDEAIFWEQLTHRLAKRDLLKKVGIKKFTEMEEDEVMEEIGNIEEQYREEFEKNDLMNLGVLKQL